MTDAQPVNKAVKTGRRNQLIWVFVILGYFLYSWISSLTPVKEYVSVILYDGPRLVKSISDESGMNIHGKAIFFSTSPELVDYPTLLKYCPNEQTESIEYGCFIPKDNKIYILHIQDERLAPLMAVTAAHEMLHKAYSNLNSKDQEYIDSELNSLRNELASNPADPLLAEFTEKIKPYTDEGISPDDLENEIHSIIGTELQYNDIELTKHYDEYFEDHFKPSDQYKLQEANIATIQAELTADKTRIDDWKATVIDKNMANQQSIQNQLNRAEYLGDIDNYNANVRIYNSNLPGIQQNIDYYNNLIAAYNKKLEDFQSIFTNLKAEQTVPDTTAL